MASIDFSSHLHDGVFQMQNIDEDIYPELFAFLRENQSKITTVDISHNHSLDHNRVLLLAAILADMPKLSEVKLNDNNLDDTSAKYISMMLDGNPRLTNVDLANNNIGETGAVAVTQAVKRRPGFKLNLQKNKNNR